MHQAPVAHQGGTADMTAETELLHVMSAASESVLEKTALKVTTAILSVWGAPTSALACESLTKIAVFLPKSKL